MAQENQYLGTCYLCDSILPQRSVTKHLQKCIAEQKVIENIGQKPEDIFLIKLFSGKEFWIYIEMKAKANFAVLDQFLRDVWCECCGHLSMFTIGGNRYEADDEEMIGESLPVAQRVLTLGTEFFYEYDFGTTTRIDGKVVSIRNGLVPKSGKICLLARNLLPEFLCPHCKKQATLICPFCSELCCELCISKHPCEDGRESMMSVVNSPRMGVCGYTGSDKTYTTAHWLWR